MDTYQRFPHKSPSASCWGVLLVRVRLLCVIWLVQHVFRMETNPDFCTASICCILVGDAGIFWEAEEQNEKNATTQTIHTERKLKWCRWRHISSWADFYRFLFDFGRSKTSTSRYYCFDYARNSRNVNRFQCKSTRTACFEAIFLFGMHKLVCPGTRSDSLKRIKNSAGPGMIVSINMDHGNMDLKRTDSEGAGAEQAQRKWSRWTYCRCAVCGMDNSRRHLSIETRLYIASMRCLAFSCICFQISSSASIYKSPNLHLANAHFIADVFPFLLLYAY